jgi:hypothetical protein
VLVLTIEWSYYVHGTNTIIIQIVSLLLFLMFTAFSLIFLRTTTYECRFRNKLWALKRNIYLYVYGSHFAQRSFYVFALSACKKNVFGVEPVERLGEITSEGSLGTSAASRHRAFRYNGRWSYSPGSQANQAGNCPKPTKTTSFTSYIRI